MPRKRNRIKKIQFLLHKLCSTTPSFVYGVINLLQNTARIICPYQYTMLCSLLLLLLSWQRYKHTLNSSTVIRRGTRAFLIMLAITNRFNAYWASRASIKNEIIEKSCFSFLSRRPAVYAGPTKEKEIRNAHLFIYLFIYTNTLFVGFCTRYTYCFTTECR